MIELKPTIAVFLAPLLALTTLAPTSTGTPSSWADLLEENAAKNKVLLQRGILKWTKSVFEDEFVPGRTIEISGNFELWWDNDKIATAYMEDLVYERKDGSYYTERGGQRTAYNGTEFRVVPNVRNPRDIAITMDPEFRLFENWFEIVGWTREPEIRALEAIPDVKLAYESYGNTEGEFLRLKVSRQDDEARLVYVYDLSKGGNLVLEEWYDEQGRLYAEDKYELTWVAGCAWLPTTLQSTIWDPEHDKITLLHLFHLELDACSFNNGAMLSASTFEIPIKGMMEISDYRSGTRFNYGNRTPWSPAKLVLGLCNIPTLTQWGLVVLAIIFFGTGVAILARR